MTPTNVRDVEAAWSESDLGRRFGVGLPWVEVMVSGRDFPAPVGDDPPRWPTEGVTQWERRHRARADSAVPPQHLRMVALRLAGLPAPVIAERVGVHVHTVHHRLRDVGLRLALTTPEDGEGASWRRLRAGYPPDTGLPAATGHRVLELWLAGASWPMLADAVGYWPGNLRRRANRSGLELRPRWYSPQVSEYLGWSRSHIYSASRRRTMPSLDGTEENGRRWWWPDTVTGWAAGLLRCPVCGAAVRGVAQHCRRHR